MENTALPYYFVSVSYTHLLTARSADISGNSYAESELIFQVRNFFGEKSVINAEAVDPLFYCRTKETAFSKYAYLFRQDTDLDVYKRQTWH